MKKIFLIAGIFAAMAIAACSGTNQHGAAGDSTENTSGDTMRSDSTAITTDTTSTGIDNSGNGGTDITDTLAEPQ